MSVRRGPITAGELLAELEQQPEYIERQRQLKAKQEANLRRYLDAAAGLLAELATFGFEVSTLADLRRPGVGNRRAVPILLKWLPLVTYVPLKFDIVATLAKPWTRPLSAAPLIAEFRRIDPATDAADGGIRWSIGDALDHVANESVVEEMIAIATDHQYGTHRGFVVAALGHMRKARDRVVPVLLRLLDDDEVAGYALLGLGRLRVAEARPMILGFLDHPKPWVRAEARKALAKLPG